MIIAGMVLFIAGHGMMVMWRGQPNPLIYIAMCALGFGMCIYGSL